MKKLTAHACTASLAALFAAAPAAADSYEVTITNLTRGQAVTPVLVVTHEPGVSFFEAGTPAGTELAALAEGGDTAPLMTLLGAMPEVYDMTTTGGLLEPGQSTTVTVDTHGNAKRLSAAAMLIPTNDAFIALSDVRGPRGNGTVSYTSMAYDAGSEPNDELCAHIPGPVCGGAGPSVEDGEGFVHVHAGIHGIGDLDASEFDWRNPVVSFSVRRVQ